MKNGDPGFDLNKLALFSAIFILLGDILTLLAAYQQYYNSQSNNMANDNEQSRQRLRQSF